MDYLFIVFLAGAGIQLVFFGGWLRSFAAMKPGVALPAQTPAVSVVVAARNAARHLTALIPLLLEQQYDRFEVVVVDDRSSDDTENVLAQLAHPRLKSQRVRELPAGMDGKKNAVAVGIAAASGEIILLTDADCRPRSRHWIKEMVAPFGAPVHVVLGYSPYYAAPGLLNAFIRFETLFTAVQYIGLALQGSPYMGVGRNLAYRKQAFVDGKGFDGLWGVTGGDDDLLVSRLANEANTRVRVGPDALVFSYPKTTWRSFFAQKIRHLSVGLRYKGVHQVRLGVFSVSLLLTWTLGAALLSGGLFTQAVAGLLMMRMVLVMATFRVASARFGDPYPLWQVVPLDFLYVFYYLSTGLRAFLIRNIKWMN